MKTNRSVLLVDCRSEHEVEQSLLSEPAVLHTILANRNDDKGPRLQTFVRTSSFKNWQPTQREEVRYVHISAHANGKELGFIDGSLPWEDVARKLKSSVPKLGSGKRRVVCLSCCHSADAAMILAPLLRGYYTGIYYVAQEEVPFDESCTLWSMFYLRKDLLDPHGGKDIRKSINRFLGGDDEVLKFRPVKNER